MSLPESDRSRIWKERLRSCHQRVGEDRGLVVEGKITRMIGLTLEAVGCRAAIGGQCDVISSSGERIESEVVGFAGESLYLMPTGDIRGLEQDARVVPTGRVCEAVVGDHLLGRVLDGAGRPLDGKGRLHAVERRPLTGKVFNPLSRTPIRKPLDVGVRAINALLSVGRGQRLGLFAGSGVGKSVLLGMMTKYTDADITVVAR
jgi:flagellum-specific ATP synthase